MLTTRSLDTRYLVAFRACFEVLDTQADTTLVSRVSRIIEQINMRAQTNALIARWQPQSIPEPRELLEDKPEAMALDCWTSMRCALGLDRLRPPGAILDQAHPLIDWLFRCDNPTCPRAVGHDDRGNPARLRSLRCSRCRKALCALALLCPDADVLRLLACLPSRRLECSRRAQTTLQAASGRARRGKRPVE